MKWIATILAVTAATAAKPHPTNVNSSPDAAVTYSDSEEPGPETFVLVKQNGAWLIRLHQTTGY